MCLTGVAQAPDDADPFCTEVLPGVGVNILDYAPQVKPLMDSRHYQNLLPPHVDAVWQEVDNDNNNPSQLATDVSWVEILLYMSEVHEDLCKHYMDSSWSGTTTDVSWVVILWYRSDSGALRTG